MFCRWWSLVTIFGIDVFIAIGVYELESELILCYGICEVLVDV